MRPLVPRQRGRRITPAQALPAVAPRDAPRAAPRTRASTRVPFAERSQWARQDRRGRVRHVGGDRAAARRRRDEDAAATSAALKRAGVDAVNVPDGPRAQSRMGALLTSLLIEQQVGIETVTHYCCRDRNLLGMLSDLLGASAMGLRNMLLITGDPPKMGPYPERDRGVRHRRDRPHEPRAAT